MKQSPIKRKTPLKPGKPLQRGCPMKRGRTCSKAAKREPDERPAYKKRFPNDEWETVLGFVPPVEVDPDDPRLEMPTETNHIFTAPRRHLVPCIITLSKISHDWFHENLSVGRMLSILVKLRKGEEDIELWRKAYGKNPAILCDRLECLLPEYAAFRAECSAGLEYHQAIFDRIKTDV